jgi:sodium transport system permease protein
MKHIITIIKKELIRVFRDRRLVFMIFIFPALMLYAMYSLMGNFMFSTPEKYIVETKNLPTEIQTMLNQSIENIEYKQYDGNLEDAKLRLKNNESDLILIFEDDFSLDLTKLNNIQIIYNPASNGSSTIYQSTTLILDAYKKAIQEQIYGSNFEIFTIESILATEEDEAIGQMYALILPFLIITFLFSGVTSVAPESIAGEKERGTITTLLVTPVKRSHIAFGKIISLSILAILSAVSSFIGVIISMPKLMGDMAGAMTNPYQMKDYAFVLAVLIVTALILVSLVSIMSCFAKNTKEASMYSMPLMVISMAISMTSMIGIKANNNLLFAIPLFNSIQLLSEIFTFELNIVHFIITIITNIVFTGILIYILTKMFDNEKIMFSK